MEWHKMTNNIPNISEINCTTNEVIFRPMTDDEYAQYEIDQLAETARKTEADAKAQAKAQAEGKLAALGLTTDDLRALGL
jgi:hypothetical protein